MKLPWFILASILVGLAVGLISGFWHTDLFAARSELGHDHGPSEVRMPALQPEGAAQPKVVVDQVNYNFGHMERRATGRHAFKFTNAGDFPLRLVKGETSCKCTLSDLANGEIPPGGSADVTLEWRAKSDEPLFRQTATILTNDPHHRSVTLTVEGFLVQTLSVNPPEIVFTGLTRKEEAQGKTRLFSVHPEMKIVGYTLANTATAEHYDVRWSPLPAEALSPGDKSGSEVIVTVKPGLPTGDIEQTVKLETNLPDVPPAELRIAGKIGSPVMIVGPVGEWNQARGQLRLGTLARSTGVRRELKLMIRGPERNQLKLSTPRTDPEQLQARLGEPQELGAVLMIPLTIEIPAGMPAINRLGNEQGPLAQVTIETNNSEVGQISVPVSFAIAE